MSSMLEDFNSRLINIMKTKKPNCSFMTKERYEDLLKKVSSSKNKTSGKKPEDYQRLKRYDVMKVGDVEKLIFPKCKDSSNVRFYVHFEELFRIIHDTHLSIGHGGRNKMIKELQKRYKNITTEEVMIYLNLCENCQKKSKVPNKGLVVKSIVVQEMLNSRCQVDIIDMQSRPDNEFKFILVYQDYLTNFVQLRALKTKRAKEIARHLINIFTIFGAPCILQSESGREFSSKIVEEACSMWPDLKIVHGAPKQSETQGLRDQADQDIENLLSCWLEGNRTSKWSEGLCFVQLMTNRTFHKNLKCTPYEAMFGTPVKVGLKTSSLPNDSIDNLRTEEQLQALIELVNSASEESTKSNINHTDMDNSTSQNNCPSEINFQLKKEDEEEVPFIKTDILSSQKQTRKRGVNAKADLGSQAKKMTKVSNVKFSSGEVGNAVKSERPNFDTASDPGSLLEVILEV